MEQSNAPSHDSMDITHDELANSANQNERSGDINHVAKNALGHVQEVARASSHPVQQYPTATGKHISRPTPQLEIQHRAVETNVAVPPHHSPPQMLNQRSNILPALEKLESSSAHVLRGMRSLLNGAPVNNDRPPMHPDQYGELWSATYGPTQEELKAQHRQHQRETIRRMLEEIQRVKNRRALPPPPREARPPLGTGLSHPYRYTGDQNVNSIPLIPAQGQDGSGVQQPRDLTIPMHPLYSRDFARFVRSRPKDVTRLAGQDYISQRLSEAVGVDGQLPSLMIQDQHLDRVIIDKPVPNSHAFMVQGSFQNWLSRRADQHVQQNPPQPRQSERQLEMSDYLQLFAPEVARQQREGTMPDFRTPDEPVLNADNWLGFRMEDVQFIEDRPLPRELDKDEHDKFIVSCPASDEPLQASEIGPASALNDFVAFGGSDEDYNARRAANPTDFELVEEHQLNMLRASHASEQPSQLLQALSAEEQPLEAPATSLDANGAEDIHRDKRVRFSNVQGDMKELALVDGRFSSSNAITPKGGGVQSGMLQPLLPDQVPSFTTPIVDENGARMYSNYGSNPNMLSPSSITSRYIASINGGSIAATNPPYFGPNGSPSTDIPADEPLENLLAARMFAVQEEIDEQDEVSMIQTTSPSRQHLKRDDAFDQAQVDQETQDVNMMDIQELSTDLHATAQVSGPRDVSPSHPVISRAPELPLTPGQATWEVQNRIRNRSLGENEKPGPFSSSIGQNRPTQHRQSSSHELPAHLPKGDRDNALADSEPPQRKRKISISMNEAQSSPTMHNNRSVFDHIQTRSRDSIHAKSPEPGLLDNVKLGLRKNMVSKPTLPPPTLDKKDKVYKCRGCKKPYVKAGNLAIHEPNCAQIITCNFCEGQFEFKTHLRDHKPHCPKNPDAPKRNVQEDAKDQGLPFRCRGCNETFYVKVQFHDHERKCGKATECSKCQEDFDTTRARNSHWEICNMGDVHTLAPHRPITRASGYINNQSEAEPNVWDKIKLQENNKRRRSLGVPKLDQHSTVETLVSMQDPEPSTYQEGSSTEIPKSNMSSIVERIKTQSRTQTRASIGTPKPDHPLTPKVPASTQKPKHLKHQLPVPTAQKDGKYQCRGPGCGALYDNPKGLAQHESQYCQAWPKCKNCNHKFANKKLRKEHQDQCTRAKNTDIEEEVPGSSQNDATHFKGRRSARHSFPAGPLGQVCSTQSRAFASSPVAPSGQTPDNESESDEPLPKQCRYCGKKYMRKKYLDEHEARCDAQHDQKEDEEPDEDRERSDGDADEHRDFTTETCPGCGEGYNSQAHLESHEENCPEAIQKLDEELEALEKHEGAGQELPTSSFSNEMSRFATPPPPEDRESDIALSPDYSPGSPVMLPGDRNLEYWTMSEIARTNNGEDIQFSPNSPVSETSPKSPNMSPTGANAVPFTESEIRQLGESIENSKRPSNLISDDNRILRNTIGGPSPQSNVDNAILPPALLAPPRMFVDDSGLFTNNRCQKSQFSKAQSATKCLEELHLGEQAFRTGNMSEIPAISRNRSPSPIKSTTPINRQHESPKKSGALNPAKVLTPFNRGAIESPESVMNSHQSRRFKDRLIDGQRTPLPSPSKHFWEDLQLTHDSTTDLEDLVLGKSPGSNFAVTEKMSSPSLPPYTFSSRPVTPQNEETTLSVDDTPIPFRQLTSSGSKPNRERTCFEFPNESSRNVALRKIEEHIKTNADLYSMKVLEDFGANKLALTIVAPLGIQVEDIMDSLRPFEVKQKKIVDEDGNTPPNLKNTQFVPFNLRPSPGAPKGIPRSTNLVDYNSDSDEERTSPCSPLKERSGLLDPDTDIMDEDEDFA